MSEEPTETQPIIWDYLSGVDAAGWLTVVAIIIGPAIAVIVTRWLDNRRAHSERRVDIFRTLMRTRRTPMYAEHVGALNLIEIEFAKDSEVITAWKKLLQHFADQHVRAAQEDVMGITNEKDIQARDTAFNKRLADERGRLLAKLLHAIAATLGFKAEQLEIFEGGYTPQGWADIELQQEVIRRFAVDLYLGRRVVPVGVMDYTRSVAAEEVADASVASAPQKND